MNSVVLYYLKNNIYIQNNDKYREMFTTVTHDKKLYLISAYCYNKRAYPGIQSILNLKDKNSIVHSTLLSALEKFNDGERQYKIPKEVYNKIIRAIDMKSCINQISVGKYSDYHEYLSSYEKIMLKLINKKMIKVIFIFYHQ